MRNFSLWQEQRQTEKLDCAVIFWKKYTQRFCTILPLNKSFKIFEALNYVSGTHTHLQSHHCDVELLFETYLFWRKPVKLLKDYLVHISVLIDGIKGQKWINLALKLLKLSPLWQSFFFQMVDFEEHRPELVVKNLTLFAHQKASYRVSLLYIFGAHRSTLVENLSYLLFKDLGFEREFKHWEKSVQKCLDFPMWKSAETWNNKVGKMRHQSVKTWKEDFTNRRCFRQQFS